MAIPPVGPGSTQLSRASQRLSSEDAARAEKEANRRVVLAEQTVEDSRRRTDQRLDAIEDQFEKRETDLNDRQTMLLEKERMKGYEELRELQRAQAAEMSRVRRDGERELAKLTDHYRNSIHTTERRGEEQLHQISSHQAKESDYQARVLKNESELAQSQHLQQSEALMARNREKLEKLNADGHAEYERIKESTQEASVKTREEFERNFAERSATQEETLASLNDRTNDAIRDVRRDTAHKLAAYSTRQKDPFYKLMDLDARLTDEGEYYELRASIPEHERDHISVSIKGNQVVLTGFRRNEEKLEESPGHVRGTNAFQSFLETFPITWPVEASKLSRSFEGDDFVARIPKKSHNLAYESPVKPTASRARLERPKFPDNLPLAKIDHERNSTEEPLVALPAKNRGANGKNKGSGTLS